MSRFFIDDCENSREILTKSMLGEFEPHSVIVERCGKCAENLCLFDSIYCEECRSHVKFLQKLSSLCDSSSVSLESVQEKLLKVSQKYKNRISDIQTVVNKIKQSTKFTCDSLQDYQDSLTYLIESQSTQISKNSSAKSEILLLTQHIFDLKSLRDQKSSELTQKEEFHKSIKRQLVSLRNDLALLQDENYENIKKIEDKKIELTNFHSRSDSRKKTKLKSNIVENSQKFEGLLEENSKIEEFIQVTEGSSRTGSITTMEEASTNNEEDESLKEISLKLQEQQAAIWQLNQEIERKKIQDLSHKSCKCFIF